MIYRSRDDDVTALAYLQQCYQMTGGSYFNCPYLMGRIYQDRGDYHQAEVYYSAAFTIYNQHLAIPLHQSQQPQVQVIADLAAVKLKLGKIYQQY